MEDKPYFPLTQLSTMSTPKTLTAILFLTSLLSLSVAGEDHRREILALINRKEKLSHFRFFWHDVIAGPNATAVTVVTPPRNKSGNAFFGTVNMMDDRLTAGPSPKSQLLGWAQGFYGVASQREVAMLMAMNFVFVQGKYNGSTITILGRNPVFEKVREMPVIGGSGLFRFARGYARASTRAFNAANGNAVVEYNVYVLHYT